MDPGVNSLGYWDGRFAGDWELLRGRDQTRFFAALALSLWPRWLADAVRADRYSLCDWGCALGDGTDALANAFGVPVTGIDFSAVAVARAAALYPGCRFVAADWLAAGDGAPARDWDLVFSSNTLEHFADPWATFAALAMRARRYIVLLLPFEEAEATRLDEHLTRFDRETIRVCPQPDWVLCDGAVADLGASPFWSGRQVLLVYGRGDELAARGVTDADCLHSRLLATDAAAADDALRRERDEAMRQRDVASATLADLAQDHRRLALDLEALRQRHDALQREHEALRVVHEQVLHSRSWALTAPLRRARAWLRPWSR